MLISVVIPAHNVAPFIGQTLASVISQTLPDWEALVVDDGSTDETWDVVQRISRLDNRIRPFRLDRNSGATVARNTAIGLARGEMLAFLDGDDWWPVTKLETQLAFMDRLGCAFSFGPYECMSEDGLKTIKRIDATAPTAVDYPGMLRKVATLGCSTVMLDRRQLPDIRFPPIRQGQDYALWLGILKRGVVAYRMDGVTAYYRLRKGSLSRNKFRKAMRQWEIYRKHEALGFIESCECFGKYAWRAIVRR
jgi:teichuronic acid biosynthesis glycosyltransferase TuaG